MTQNLLKQKSPVLGIKRASLDGLERLQTEYYRPDKFFTSVPSQISVRIFWKISMAPYQATKYIVVYSISPPMDWSGENSENLRFWYGPKPTKTKIPCNGHQTGVSWWLGAAANRILSSRNFFTSVPSQISVRIFWKTSMALTKTLLYNNYKLDNGRSWWKFRKCVIFVATQNLLKQKSPNLGIKQAFFEGLERLQTEYYHL